MSIQIKSSIETLDWQNFINRGLQFGDGLFETMSVVDGVIPLWDFHWKRLTQSAQVLSLDLPAEKALKKHVVDWHWLAPKSVLKLMVFRRASERGYLAKHADCDWVLQASPWSVIEKKPLNLGAAKLRLAEQPKLAGLKHLNRLEQVLLANELAESGFDELLVCSQSGDVIEAVSQNIVLEKNGQLFTPALLSCGVSGVGLAWLKSHVDVENTVVTVKELAKYDAMFLINSVRGVTQVDSVGGVKKFSTDSLLHDRINRLWNELMFL